MKVIIPGLGMYNYLLPVLSAWAARMGYELPDTNDENLRCYYCDEMESTILGNHLYWNGKTIIKIRPGIVDELSTWAHEFAHMIQSVNLGRQWRRSYDASTEDYGYYGNIFEVEARECGKMALVFDAQGWLLWEVDYNAEGECSVWPRPKPAQSRTWGMSFEKYREHCWYEIVDHWDSDFVKFHLPAQKRLTIAVKIILRTFVGYINNNAVTNMQQYAA